MSSSTPLTTVVAMFDDPGGARQAVAALRDAGFGPEEIGFVARHNPEAGGGADGGGGGSAGRQVSGEAAAAAVLAAGLAAAGMTAGSAMAPAGSILGATAIGAVLIADDALGQGLRNAFVGAGMPADEASYYEHEYDRGRAIVIVKAGGRTAEASSILKQHGGYGKARQVPPAQAK
jgi:hypothetical protein